ncbi:Metaxin-like protein [Fulvia fulva]|nr:Metaxin-like protein [Fulvia fulva]
MMSSKMMRLFILGPAFGLPSIDAECNAAVALLQLRVKDQHELIPTHDQTHRLPFLIDGQAQVSGFNNIVRHFANRRISDEAVRLDAKQRTDSLAFTSFIESNAQTLLDISLYVGFENYRYTTRPAFTKILPWHINYIIPPQRRTAARSRTEHLAISSIDVDNVHEDMSNKPPGYEGVGKEQPGFEAEAKQRASLLLPRKDTLRSLLQRPEHAAVFKLNALVDNFFEPLHEALQHNDYLLGTAEPTSIDCLLYGYLSLILYPQVPQDWLASTIKRKYKSLVAYTDRLHSLLSLATDADHVLRLSQVAAAHAHDMSLPWKAPNTSTMSATIKEIRQGIWMQLPVVGGPRLALSNAKQFPYLDRNLGNMVLSLTASLALAGYLTIRFGFLSWPHGEEVHIFGRRRMADYGHLGDALAGIRLLGPQAGR